MDNKRILILFTIIFAFLFVVAGRAEALTLSPARLEMTGNKGQALSGKITLINENKETETFYPSYANFEAQGESGDPSFVPAKDDLGTWISTDASTTLKGGESKDVDFAINIPANAEAGGHFATIFWGTGGSNTQNVTVGSKTGILLLLSVNGDVKESAGFLNFNTVGKQFFYSTLPVSFEYRFRNDGGDRVKPAGDITIRDTVFFPTKNIDANAGGGNILPNSTRKFNVKWQEYDRPNDYIQPTSFFKKFASDVSYQWKNFAIGLYSAKLNVAYGADTPHAQKMVFFFVFPWQLALVLLVAISFVIFILRIVLNRYNSYIIKKANATRN